MGKSGLGSGATFARPNGTRVWLFVLLFALFALGTAQGRALEVRAIVLTVSDLDPVRSLRKGSFGRGPAMKNGRMLVGRGRKPTQVRYTKVG